MNKTDATVLAQLARALVRHLYHNFFDENECGVHVEVRGDTVMVVKSLRHYNRYGDVVYVRIGSGRIPICSYNLVHSLLPQEEAKARALAEELLTEKAKRAPRGFHATVDFRQNPKRHLNCQAWCFYSLLPDLGFDPKERAHVFLD
jgi:hypothetical protein